MAKHNKQPQPCQTEQEQLFLFPQLLAAPSSFRGAEVTAEFGLEGFGNIQKLLCLSQVKHTQTGLSMAPHPRAATQNPFLAQQRCWPWLRIPSWHCLTEVCRAWGAVPALCPPGSHAWWEAGTRTGNLCSATTLTSARGQRQGAPRGHHECLVLHPHTPNIPGLQVQLLASAAASTKS